MQTSKKRFPQRENFGNPLRRASKALEMPPVWDPRRRQDAWVSYVQKFKCPCQGNLGFLPSNQTNNL